MRTAAGFSVVLITTPNLRCARRLARLALRDKLVACANLVPRVESHYSWRGKFETGNETLLLLKMRRGNLARLEKMILKEHPYETPELIEMALKSGTERYLEWLGAVC
jgi:periplasmic divalent cation tolerance protein